MRDSGGDRLLSLGLRVRVPPVPLVATSEQFTTCIPTGGCRSRRIEVSSLSFDRSRPGRVSMSKKLPKYRRHKASGRAVVTINGRDVYLGVYGSEESKTLYDQKIAEWLASGRGDLMPANPRITVAELANSYLKFAATWYVKNGKTTNQLVRVTQSLAIVTRLYGQIPAAEFGPLRLKAAREMMIRRGWVRTYINQCVGCVKRAFKWAAAEEMIPAAVLHGLQAVGGLQAGRCAARERTPILPAPEESVRAVQGEVSPQVRDMIELQLLTGMRPGEVVQIRPGAINRSGDVWVYTPDSHKTEHTGRSRVILIGPEAQKVLAPYLLRDASAACFSPMEAETARIGIKPNPRRSRPVGDRYTVSGYAHAVQYAIRRLKRNWHPPLVVTEAWHPNQLRHAAATRLVAQFGWEVARILLGHRSVDMTRIYAENDMEKAADAARKVG